MNDHDWDDRTVPLAYLITFRTYGTWLHGDERHSVDRHGKNIYGTPKVLPSRNLDRMMNENRRSEGFVLNASQRTQVEHAVRAVCSVRECRLYAINVRTNHVHIVVTSLQTSEVLLNAFKANSTRELRAAGLVSADRPIWSRGGSTRYLWKPSHIEGAINYVLHGQGGDLPNF